MIAKVIFDPNGDEQEIEVAVWFDYTVHQGRGARLFTAMAGPDEPTWAELNEMGREDGEPMCAALTAAAQKLWDDALSYQVVNER